MVQRSLPQQICADLSVHLSSLGPHSHLSSNARNHLHLSSRKCIYIYIRIQSSACLFCLILFISSYQALCIRSVCPHVTPQSPWPPDHVMPETAQGRNGEKAKRLKQMDLEAYFTNFTANQGFSAMEAQ